MLKGENRYQNDRFNIPYIIWIAFKKQGKNNSHKSFVLFIEHLKHLTLTNQLIYLFKSGAATLD